MHGQLNVRILLYNIDVSAWRSDNTITLLFSKKFRSMQTVQPVKVLYGRCQGHTQYSNAVSYRRGEAPHVMFQFI